MTTTKTHETRRTLAEDVFYPDHEPRTESPMFRASKREMKAAGGYVCAVCGDDQAIESHHRFFEWAFSHAIDWKWIRGVALNEIDTMFSHKLQRVVPIPRQHPIWDVIKLTQGFDWEAFDPAGPEAFVDSTYNQLLLCALHHRGKDHGRHEESDPVWSVQAFLLPGFVYSPDGAEAVACEGAEMTLVKLVLPYVLALLLGVAAGGYGEHLISAREIAGMKADAAQAQAKAIDAARAEEQRRTAAQSEIAKDANQQRTAALADAFAARAAAGSLQQRVDQLVAAARHPAAAAGSPAAGHALDMLADVLGRADQRAGELAEYADRARIAGQQCERDYDALTAAAR